MKQPIYDTAQTKKKKNRQANKAHSVYTKWAFEEGWEKLSWTFESSTCRDWTKAVNQTVNSKAAATSKSEMQRNEFCFSVSKLVQKAEKMKIHWPFTESHEGRHHHKQEQVKHLAWVQRKGFRWNEKKEDAIETSLNTTRRLVFIGGFDFGRVGLIKSPAPPTLVFLVCSPVEVASPRLCPQHSPFCLPPTVNTVGDMFDSPCLKPSIRVDLGKKGGAVEPGCQGCHGWLHLKTHWNMQLLEAHLKQQCSVIRLMRRCRHTVAPSHVCQCAAEPANDLCVSEMVWMRVCRASWHPPCLWYIVRCCCKNRC